MFDRLSIIIPTRDARRPLARCLTSIRDQLHSGDEVIVVGDTLDGQLPAVAKLVDSYGPRFSYLPFAGEQHDYGHSQINVGIELATGDWILVQDDDDVYTVGAFTAIRKAIGSLTEPRPLLFRFVTHYGMTFWDRPVLEQGHIGGHCAVFPNIPDKLGKWSARYEGDYDYITSTLALWPANSVVWCREIIAVARPEAIMALSR